MTDRARSPKERAPRRAKPPASMTYEEFLEWLTIINTEGDTRAEWVDGRVLLLDPPSREHQDLILFLGAILRYYVEAHRLGQVIVAPFQMKTGPDLPGREPDVVFVAKDHGDLFEKNYLNGPADVVVEIVSPDSRSRDRGKKYYEYEKGGVREYWLIDPDRKQAEFYRLDDRGFFQLVPLEEGRIFRSAVMQGLWLAVDWLWQDPLPELSTVLREWGL
ncbi:MAG: Uma2 family endonuclease [Planctomycetota bacterium]